MPIMKWALAVFSGVLLAMPWYDCFPSLFLHLALVPLFIATSDIINKKDNLLHFQVYQLAFVAFLTWNIASMWWVYKISFWAAMFIITANSALYTLVFVLYFNVRRILGKGVGFVVFVCFWLAFEFYCLHAGFAQPWLVLGNGLAGNVKNIQWYEFTGVLGGSFWVLLGNILFFLVYLYFIKGFYKKTLFFLLLAMFIWVIPLYVSRVLPEKGDSAGHKCNIAILQPNVDPYTEKFDKLSQDEQLNRILQLADSVNTGDIDYFLAPETAIDNNIWESELTTNYSIYKIRDFISMNPNSAFVIGAITKRECTNEANIKATTRFNAADSMYYDVFNSALQIDTSFKTFIYHKSKLVLGVERAFFPGISKFMDKYLLKLGGSEGSLGTQLEPGVFIKYNGQFRPAPVICFESVYGEYVTKYVQKGANLIFIITNDGWWVNTPGYKQHLRFSQIRAIENRRFVARSANTGISAFIDIRGNIINSTGWWERVAIKGEVLTNNSVTFYAKYGDFIGVIAIWASVILLLVALVKRFIFKH